MAASLTTRLDEALFDDERYGFDVDVRAYQGIVVPALRFKRTTTTQWVREP